ncbi:MAG: head GIN domain-containing protein [Bacteroidaceae bacterium]|nr:head GIN domain-containing protein [Bacteroidaceae bacterium]
MRTKNVLFALSMCLLAPALTSCLDRPANTASTLHPLVDRDDYRDSQTWGKVITKKLDLSTFTNIDLTSNADIKFVQGDQLTVEAYGNEKAIAENDITVKDGTLTVAKKEGSAGTVPCITIIVKAPVLESINVSGSGDIDIENTAEFDYNLSINASGAGDIELDHITCHALNIDISGSGDIDAKKIKCANADIRISGAGDMNADVKANDINVQISGAGDAELDVKCQNLAIHANGTGEIELKGKCTNLTKQSSGLASIDTRQLTIQENISIQ